MSAVSIRVSAGRGRTVCLLSEGGGFEPPGFQILFSQLSERARALWCEVPAVSGDSWEGIRDDFIGTLEGAGVRQASIVAYGPAATVALAAYLKEPKLFRTLVLIDATSRAHPSALSRGIDWLEEHLPLGLPLRLRSKDFDAKPFLHRVRCPTLLVVSPTATWYQQSQSKEMSARIPTAWWFSLAEESAGAEGTADSLKTSSEPAEALTRAILDFYDVPARCPQKRRDEGSSTVAASS